MARHNILGAITAAIILVINVYTQAGTYTSDFYQYLSDNQSKEYINAIINMSDRVDLDAIKAELRASKGDRQQWHETVIRALQDKAMESQVNILAKLEELKKQGTIADYKSLWLGNIIIVTATQDALDEIVQRDDVDQIAPNYEIESIKDKLESNESAVTAGMETALSAIHADEVWAMGYTGEGRLVSHLDTGVDGEHAALADRWRGLNSRYTDNPEWAWYDPVTETTFPFDSDYHGTHTMGTMCGLGAETGDTIGVAFGAEWISAAVIDRVDSDQTIEDALTAFQWIADPDEDPSTVWDVPDVCSNSWGIYSGYDPCDATFWDAIDAIEAAGVVVLFAAGNEGEDGSETIRRPADRATTDINAFSIGSVYGSVEGFPISESSSRGPSYCTDDGSAAIKPEICAPGVSIRSAYAGGDYITMSGTSMATPHVAGVVALMRQANPDLSSDEIKQILLETAGDLGDEGNDNTYGMGMLDAYEAVQHALALRQDLGALTGTITDNSTGEPIEGITIAVIDRNWCAVTNSEGAYCLFMPADTLYDIKISSSEYLPIYDSQSVTASETTTVNYSLEPKVMVTFSVSFDNGDDISYRTFYIKGSWDNDGYYDETWSDDLFAIADDGEEPDETAGDGIYTGETILARDLDNTYNWAVYTENYGVNSIDDAFLTAGSEFNIDDLEPVTVPVLSPNPSGADNNFVFSVEGDNGLSSDLEPYINGVPYKWGASLYLSANVTYSFVFHVMHGDEPVYGDGGVGGAEITYTPTADGAYDFIFNDNDDSYVIRLSTANGAPSYLEAISGKEHHIPITWAPPGITSSVELAYDDGVAAHGWYSLYPEILIGVMFIPESYPVIIDSVMVHVITEGDNIWPWPDDENDTIGVSIFLDNGSGYPEEDPVYYTETAAELGEWIKLDISGIAITKGYFWVCMNNVGDDGTYDGLARDEETDYQANQWYCTDRYGSWSIGSPFGGDNLIRAKVFSSEASTWLAYDDGIPAKTVTAPASNGDLSAKFVSNNSVSGNEIVSNGMAYYPHILSDPPMITETETIYGYNLYRSTTSGPYDQGQKINSSPIPTIYYDDWGNDTYGPIVNGVTYYYEASAIYNVGGEYIEAGPSNEDTATAVNKPPDAPVNLAGEVDGNTVTLSWDANTDYDIAAYNVYRRESIDDDFVLVGAVDHPVTTYSEVVSEDGIYRYKIKAIDAQGLESDGFSNSIGLGIGLIPPGEIAASTDLEFQIKSMWRNTGNSAPVSLNVALINSQSYDAGNGVMEYLVESGLVADYTIFTTNDETPTINELESYDMVLIWYGQTPDDPDSLGDVLADFVDLGKPVVAFNNCFYATRAIGGRFMDDYCSFEPTDVGTYEESINLGEYDEDNPIMTGVTELSSACVFDVGVRNNAEVVAYWENDYPLIAIPGDYSIVCLNIAINGSMEYCSGDVMQLIYNAVDYAANAYGADPDSYNIYRSDNEESSFELLATLAGNVREYTDSSITVNAIPYYYQVTAIWDGEESEPSNVAEGVGQNYAPEAPVNLAAAVNDYAVNLTWTFTNLKSDFDHYNIYRRTSDETVFVLIDSTEVKNYTDNVSEMANYKYVVTAVDNGDPQLESEYSNIVTALVGCLPPTELTAISNQDGVVPLSWNSPGYSPIEMLCYDDGVAADGYYFDSPEYLMAKQFTATAPVYICSLYIHIITEGDDLWPWPDDTHDPVEIQIWDDDGSGQPGSVLYDDLVTCELGEWITIGFDTTITCATDNFWVSCNTYMTDAIGIDAASDYSSRDWTYQGSWIQGALYDGDHMIRAAITVENEMELLTESNPISKTVTSLTTTAIDDNPQLFDTEEMLGYYIYRSISADVPIDDSCRITSSYITATSYADEEATNGTTYYYVTVAAYNNDGTVEYSEASNEVSATPMAAGQLAADSISVTTSADSTDAAISVPLMLTNNGGLPVTFTTAITSDDDIITDNGGPDNYGYSWVDSDDEDGPEYNWVDITGIGVQIANSDDEPDFNVGPFTMGFDFNFYGTDYSTFRLCSNGFISFTSSSMGGRIYSLPSGSEPYTLIAPFWSDIDAMESGEFYYYTAPESTVVSWINVYLPVFDDECTFQLILTSDGMITYQYNDIENDFDIYEYSVGIQNSDGSDGLGICYESDYLHNDMAVRIKTGWLRTEPYSGTIAGGESLGINAILDPGTLDDGTYSGTITLSSYDINHELDPIDIPVTFIVGDVGIDGESSVLPVAYSLDQNYPNPFNAQTEIRYALPADGDVKLEIYNVLGQKVTVLVDEKQTAGYHSIIWDATNESGQTVSSGIYLYKLIANENTFIKKMIMLK